MDGKVFGIMDKIERKSFHLHKKKPPLRFHPFIYFSAHQSNNFDVFISITSYVASNSL